MVVYNRSTVVFDNTINRLQVKNDESFITERLVS